ncbi:unnamed protein product, partial [Pseudo-nitzschia multistriata]
DTFVREQIQRRRKTQAGGVDPSDSDRSCTVGLVWKSSLVGSNPRPVDQRSNSTNRNKASETTQIRNQGSKQSGKRERQPGTSMVPSAKTTILQLRPGHNPGTDFERKKKNKIKENEKETETDNRRSVVFKPRLAWVFLAVFLVLSNLYQNPPDPQRRGGTRAIAIAKAKAKTKTTPSRKPKRLAYYQAWDPVKGVLNASLLRDTDGSGTKAPQHQTETPLGTRLRKKTSFELLQEVLHDHEREIDHNLDYKLDTNHNDNGSNNSKAAPKLSCFAPDLERTHRAVTRARQEWKKREQIQRSKPGDAVLGLPLLNVGMPKSGSSTLLRFVRHDLKWKATHNVVERAASERDGDQRLSPTRTLTPIPTSPPTPPPRRSYVGKLMKQAIDVGHPSPFSLLSQGYRAHTQMDYTVVSSSGQEDDETNFFPQISLLDEIHASEPNATFVLLFRPIDDWIRSVRSWHRLPFRWMEASKPYYGAATQIPGLVLTEDQRTRRTERPEEPLAATESQLRDWWCHHVRHIRRFVDEYPSHTLVELDLYDNHNRDKHEAGDDSSLSTTETLRELFFPPGERNRTITWGMANANPAAAFSIGSRPGGPIARKTKYYEQWNHETQRLELERELEASTRTKGHQNSSNSSATNSTLPKTSLEILETVLREREESKEEGRDWDEECFLPRPFSVEKDVSHGSMMNSNSAALSNPTNNNSDDEVTKGSKAAGTVLLPRVPYPILNVGLPMDPWSDALRDFFSCLGLKVVHRKALGSNGTRRIGSVGKKMREAVRDAHVGPISGFFGTNRQVFSALDYTPSLDSASAASSSSSSSSSAAIFPQIQLLDELHEEDPSFTFLLPVPPIDEWVKWAQTFHNFSERWARMEMPGLVLTDEQRSARHRPCPLVEKSTDGEQQQQNNNSNNGNHTATLKEDTGNHRDTEEQPEETRRCLRLTDQQLRDWWCGHVRHVRSFAEAHGDSHALLELDLSPASRGPTSSALNKVFGANQTCIAKLFPKRTPAAGES